jgi:hypothetical protein
MKVDLGPLFFFLSFVRFFFFYIADTYKIERTALALLSSTARRILRDFIWGMVSSLGSYAWRSSRRRLRCIRIVELIRRGRSGVPWRTFARTKGRDMRIWGLVRLCSGACLHGDSVFGACLLNFRA